MSARVESIFEAVMRLSDDERNELYDRLYLGMSPEQRADIDPEWAEEAERRMQELRDGKVKSVPWEEVRDSLLNRAAK